MVTINQNKSKDSKKENAVIIAPLLNLELKGIKKIDVGNFKIRELNKKEKEILAIHYNRNKEHICGKNYQFSLLFSANIYNNRSKEYIESTLLYGIELKNKIPFKNLKNNISLRLKLLNKIKMFAIFFRFFLSEIQRPLIPPIMIIYRNNIDTITVNVNKFHILNTILVDFISYTYLMKLRIPKCELINRKELDKFRKFWERIKDNVFKSNFLTTALKRFNLSDERGLGEENKKDILIDLIISLEALYLNEKETSYKLCLRCAHFIGENGDKRKEIFETIQKAYNVRNKIVHGDRLTLKTLKKLLKNEYKELEDEDKRQGHKSSSEEYEKYLLIKITNKIKEYTERSIREFIYELEFKNIGDEKIKIIEDIDKKILGCNREKR